MRSQETMGGGNRTIRKIELTKEDLNDVIKNYIVRREHIPDGFSISVTLMKDFSARVDILTGDWSGITGDDNMVGIEFCPEPPRETARRNWYRALQEDERGH